MWNYLNIKAIVLLFLVQDLTFHLSNDLLLFNFYPKNNPNFKSVTYFFISCGFLIRLLFELYTKITYAHKTNFRKIDTVKLDTSFENLGVVDDIITEQQLFEEALQLNLMSVEEIKQNLRLKIWMSGVEKTLDRLDISLKISMIKGMRGRHHSDQYALNS